MKTLKYAVAFTIGFCSGAYAMRYMLQKKYDRLVQEEIDSVKQAFSRNFTSAADNDSKVDTADASQIMPGKTAYPTADIRSECEKEIKKEKYYPDEFSESHSEFLFDRVTTDSDRPPYVISPDQFGEFADYETVSLWWYADHILADENYDIIEDVDNVVGEGSLTRFGEYDDDAVHVRNERLKLDYEILLDPRTYSEAHNLIQNHILNKEVQ